LSLAISSRNLDNSLLLGLSFLFLAINSVGFRFNPLDSKTKKAFSCCIFLNLGIAWLTSFGVYPLPYLRRFLCLYSSL
jgi:hypothetical protein